MLTVAVEYFREAGMVAIPIWRMAHDAGASLAGAARRLGVEAVMVGTSQRGAVWHLLRGNVLRPWSATCPSRRASGSSTKSFPRALSDGILMFS